MATKVKHGVKLAYGKTSMALSSYDLQLIADALEIVSPDDDLMPQRARELASAFESLADYSESVGQ